MQLCSYLPSSKSIRGNICSDIQGVWTEHRDFESHLTSLQSACRLKSFFEKFLFRASCSQLRAVLFVPSRAWPVRRFSGRDQGWSILISFQYNSKVTRGGHEFRHENMGTRAQGTKARVLDMLITSTPGAYDDECGDIRSTLEDL